MRQRRGPGGRAGRPRAVRRARRARWRVRGGCAYLSEERVRLRALHDELALVVAGRRVEERLAGVHEVLPREVPAHPPGPVAVRQLRRVHRAGMCEPRAPRPVPPLPPRPVTRPACPPSSRSPPPRRPAPAPAPRPPRTPRPRRRREDARAPTAPARAQSGARAGRGGGRGGGEDRMTTTLDATGTRKTSPKNNRIFVPDFHNCQLIAS